VLEIDELDADDCDELLELLLDEFDDCDEDDSDEPLLELSELLLLDSSGMSVHVAHISMANARRRMRLPWLVSAFWLGPVSFAPCTVNPLVRLSHCRKLRSRTISRAAPRFVVTVLPVESVRLSA